MPAGAFQSWSQKLTDFTGSLFTFASNVFSAIHSSSVIFRGEVCGPSAVQRTQFVGRRAMGTTTSPTAIVKNTPVSDFRGDAWNGTAYVTVGQVYIYVDNLDYSTNPAGAILFAAAPLNGSGAVNRMLLSSSGMQLYNAAGDTVVFAVDPSGAITGNGSTWSLASTSGANVTLQSTTHATKGELRLNGTTTYVDATGRMVVRHIAVQNNDGDGVKLQSAAGVDAGTVSRNSSGGVTLTSYVGTTSIIGGASAGDVTVHAANSTARVRILANSQEVITVGLGASLSFFGATPVARPAAIANATDAATAISQLNLTLAALRSLGLIAT